MSKAGKSSESNVTVGTAIPKPDRYVDRPTSRTLGHLATDRALF